MDKLRKDEILSDYRLIYRTPNLIMLRNELITASGKGQEKPMLSMTKP